MKKQKAVETFSSNINIGGSPKSLSTRARDYYINTHLSGLTSVNVNEENKLERNQIMETSKPHADIVYKDTHGVIKYIEIKATEAQGKCFGACTLSEVLKALEHPKNYIFQLIVTNKSAAGFRLGPAYDIHELIDLKILSIPPIKLYFNLSVINKVTRAVSRRADTLIATVRNILGYDKFRNDHIINENNWFPLLTMFEYGNLDLEMEAPLFQYLIDTGKVWNLQGHHGNHAVELIQDGICIFGEKPFKSAYGGVYPSRYELPQGVAGTIEYQKEMRNIEG